MTNALDLDGLTKSFGPLTAVDDVGLTIPAGQIVAVLGPNGAGKSTLNEMILGLIPPSGGRVTVFGASPTAAVAAGRVGAMLQGGALLDQATVREMLAMMHGLHRHPLPLAEVIERAACGDFLDTRTERLSGGQAQRARYALALMPDPDLLILDEPTVAMDVETRRGFWASMRDFVASGRTVVFATHYLEEADEVADRIVLLRAGRVVADGSGAQLKASVGGRTIRFADSRPDADTLSTLPGVTGVEIAGSIVHLRTNDSDACLRVLLTTDAHDIEVSAPRLEEAFRTLTTAREQELVA